MSAEGRFRFKGELPFGIDPLSASRDDGVIRKQKSNVGCHADGIVRVQQLPEFRGCGIVISGDESSEHLQLLSVICRVDCDILCQCAGFFIQPFKTVLLFHMIEPADDGNRHYDHYEDEYQSYRQRFAPVYSVSFFYHKISAPVRIFLSFILAHYVIKATVDFAISSDCVRLQDIFLLSGQNRRCRNRVDKLCKENLSGILDTVTGKVYTEVGKNML